MKMRSVFLGAGIFLFLVVSTSNGVCAERVLRVSDGAILDFQQMTRDVKTADLVFVGEAHSELRHHHAQLRIMKALAASGKNVAVGLEMFRADSQKELDLWVEGGMALSQFVEVYSRNWGMPWPWYMKILTYAREAGIPLIGLNLPGPITEKVSRHGYDSLTRDELRQLPPGITFDIDDRHLKHMRKIYETHGKGDASFENFNRAQLAWDKTMAYHLMNFLKKKPGTTVVVLAGMDHAMKIGVPEQIRRQSAYRSVVILPEMPGRIERNAVTVEDCDYLLVEW
jgi:uncharacterized iron-regulated protein